jgi:hypothetical protein
VYENKAKINLKIGLDLICASDPNPAQKAVEAGHLEAL